MSEASRSRSALAGAGALLGAGAGGIFAALEIAAMALVPVWAPPEAPAAPLLLPGAALLAATWLLFGALAGAGLCAGGAALGWPVERDAGEGLAALATLPVTLAFSAHVVAYSSPQPPLAFVLTGCSIAAAAAIASAVSPSLARRLRFAASPWTVSALLVGLAVVELDQLRHAPVARQGAAALAVGSVVLLSAALAQYASRRRSRGARREARPRPLAGAALVLGVSFASVVWAARPPAPTLPDPQPDLAASGPPVVLITLDTVRSDHLSAYGYERDTSPSLEAFARSATLYRRAIAASDLTLSTHASLFTGLYTRQHGARVHHGAGATGIDSRVAVLAETLRERGFLTLAVVANSAYLAARYGFDRGFDHYDDRRPSPLLPDPRPHLPSRSVVRLLSALGVGADPFARAKTAYRGSEEINREVFALLERVAADARPFFLFVNYMDAHWPYDPPPPFDDRYPGRLERAAERPSTEDFRAARTLERPLSEAHRAHMVSQYDGELAYVDEQLGRLLARLDEIGLLDASLVVITSDHGEAFGEHGLVSHGVSVYQEQVHVPLVVKLPGQREPQVAESWVSSVDLVPTVLDLLGEAPPAYLAGRSWAGGGAGAERVVVSESYPDTALYRASPRFRRVHRAIFSGDHKLVAPTPGRPELYDLARDPAERRALGASAPRGRELASALDAWMHARPAGRGEEVPVDDATAERLRALGYAR